MVTDNIDLWSYQEIKSFSKGAKLLEFENYERAIEKFRKVLSNDPYNAEAHSMLAFSLAGAGRYEAAEHEARTALSLAPDEPLSFYTLGIVYREAGWLKETEKMFQKAAEIDPSNFLCHLADVKNLRGDFKGAEKVCLKALELDPADQMVRGILAVSCHYQKRDNEAMKLYIEALKDNPENPGLQNNLGSIYLMKNMPDEALVHFRAALRANPGLKVARDNIVRALKAKNRFYGVFWRWGIFLDKFPPAAKIAIIIGGWFGILFILESINVYTKFADNNVELSILFMIITIFFVAGSWAASQVFNKLVEAGRIK